MKQSMIFNKSPKAMIATSGGVASGRTLFPWHLIEKFNRMKKIIIACIVLATTIASWQSCSDDLGNYSYSAPETPVVAGLDSLYTVSIGAKLVVKPKISFSSSKDVSLEWKISVPSEMREIQATGDSLALYFTLGAGEYDARLAVVDNHTGMKYFHYFKVKALASFSEGIVLLASNQGKAEVSFIKKDSTVLPNIYEHTYGEALPDGPLQIVPIQHQYMGGTPYLGYWIICSDNKNPGVELDVNTFRRIKYFRENFFNPPSGELNAQFFYPTPVGVMNGVVNNKLYFGASSTYYISPIYGYFGTPVLGDYSLAPHLIYSDAYIIGYDPQQKKLVFFDGGGNYYGADYATDGTAFDPKNLDVDVLYMSMVNADTHYVIGRNKLDQQVHEYKFGVKSSPRTFSPTIGRVFAGNALVTAHTKWVLTGTEIFYFTSNDKIYRYNPLNEEVKSIDLEVGGHEISCLKLSADGTSLIVGAEGHLYFLDITTGKEGKILSHYSGFNGAPVDVYVKK